MIEERCLSLLRANDATDLPYPLAVNPYRGCEHACQGCGLAGTRIHAKVNAAECLRDELRRPGYVPRPLNLGSATDAYQPVERRLRLTRSLIEVLHEAQHPFALATRSAGVVRDLDLLAGMAARRQVLVLISLGTLDAGLSRRLEPGASPPALRLAAIRTLAQAGVWVGLNLAAPLQLDADGAELEALLTAAAQAGARSVHCRAPGDTGDTADRLQAIRSWIGPLAARLGLATTLPDLDGQHFVPPRPNPPRTDATPKQRELF